jgi:hypothetical protein
MPANLGTFLLQPGCGFSLVAREACRWPKIVEDPDSGQIAARMLPVEDAENT